MKNVEIDHLTITDRKRAKLALGRWGWTGIVHYPASGVSITVVGRKNHFRLLPKEYRTAAGAGSQEERRSSKRISLSMIS